MINFFAETCKVAGSNSIIDPSKLPQTCANQKTLDTAFLVAFSIIGGLVLLVVVLAGARYIFSKGEPDGIQKAKNELKYALIGLLIVSLAGAIVGFVLGRLG